MKNQFVGLLVDTIEDVITIESKNIQPTPANLNEIEEKGDGSDEDFTCYQTILNDEYFDTSSILNFEDIFSES